jgi:hypothetical protein
VYCAGEHLSRSCSQKADGTLSEYKCANCGGAHAAWATECPERAKEVENMQEMGRYRPRYHPVPAYFSINAPSVTLCPSPASSWGTPVASSTSEGSGTESSDSPAVGAAQLTTEGSAITRSSSGLQSSQWKVVQKKKQGGERAAASLDQRQPRRRACPAVRSSNRSQLPRSPWISILHPAPNQRSSSQRLASVARAYPSLLINQFTHQNRHPKPGKGPPERPLRVCPQQAAPVRANPVES